MAWITSMESLLAILHSSHQIMYDYSLKLLFMMIEFIGFRQTQSVNKMMQFVYINKKTQINIYIYVVNEHHFGHHTKFILIAAKRNYTQWIKIKLFAKRKKLFFFSALIVNGQGSPFGGCIANHNIHLYLHCCYCCSYFSFWPILQRSWSLPMWRLASTDGSLERVLRALFAVSRSLHREPVARTTCGASRGKK